MTMGEKKMMTRRQTMMNLLRVASGNELYGCPRHLMPRNLRAYRKFLENGFSTPTPQPASAGTIPLSPADKIAARYRQAVGE